MNPDIHSGLVDNMLQCLISLSLSFTPSLGLQVACSVQGLQVFVQDRSFLCVRGGQLLSVSVRLHGWVHNGVLVCPSCHDLCPDCPLPHLLPPLNTSRSSPIGEFFQWVDEFSLAELRYHRQQHLHWSVQYLASSLSNTSRSLPYTSVCNG